VRGVGSWSRGLQRRSDLVRGPQFLRAQRGAALLIGGTTSERGQEHWLRVKLDLEGWNVYRYKATLPHFVSFLALHVLTQTLLVFYNYFRMDREQLWTLSNCDGGFLLAYGAIFGGDATECADRSSVHKTRCCADIGDGYGGIPAPAPTSVPSTSSSALLASASSCDELGWTNAEKFGDSGVCGESDLGLGGCSGDLTWSEARNFCERSGARLCSLVELQADEAKSTGCG